jgi:hypothetical protein
MKKKPTNFSKIIKDLRDSGMTNRAIASECDCSAVFIGQLFNGRRGQPTYDLGRDLVLLHMDRT